MEGRGLSLVVARYEPRSDIPYGYITVQKPEANITIRKGRVVNVLVSEGPQLIELPGVANMTPEEAGETLAAKQMEVERTIHVPSDRPGRVVAQSPGAGARMLEGSSGDPPRGQGAGALLHDARYQGSRHSDAHRGTGKEEDTATGSPTRGETKKKIKKTRRSRPGPSGPWSRLQRRFSARTTIL